jgi:hypothetical protein
MLKKFALSAAVLAGALTAGCFSPAVEEEEPTKKPAVEVKAYPAAASAKEAIGQRLAANDMGGLALYVIDAVKTAPGGPGACPQLRRWEDMGEVPADVKPASLRKYAGAHAFSVHCPDGFDADSAFRGQYLLLLPSDSVTPIVLECVPKGGNPKDDNICWTRWAERK